MREYDHHHDQVAGEGCYAAETPRFLRSAALAGFVCLFGQSGEKVGREQGLAPCSRYGGKQVFAVPHADNAAEDGRRGVGVAALAYQAVQAFGRAVAVCLPCLEYGGDGVVHIARDAAFGVGGVGLQAV